MIELFTRHLDTIILPVDAKLTPLPIDADISSLSAILLVRTSAYGCVLGTALVTVMIACNQSLPIILTSQICDTVEPDRQKLAIDIENTAVVLAPLIPWNIAGMVLLATISVPTVSILAAYYLYMIPLWNWYTSGRGNDRGRCRI